MSSPDAYDGPPIPYPSTAGDCGAGIGASTGPWMAQFRDDHGGAAVARAVDRGVTHVFCVERPKGIEPSPSVWKSGTDWPVDGPESPRPATGSAQVSGSWKSPRARLHQTPEDVRSRGEDGDLWAIGSGPGATDRDRVESYAGVEQLGEHAGFLLVDVGGKVASGRVEYGDGVPVELVGWFTDEGYGPACGEVACLARVLVVVLASELGDVDASVWEARVGWANQQPGGVLAEPQHGLVACVCVGDQTKWGSPSGPTKRPLSPSCGTYQLGS